MIQTQDKPKVTWGGLDEQNRKCYPLHYGQTRVLKSPCRFTAAIAGTGGGKTCIGPLWIARQISKLQNDIDRLPLLGMVVAPTYQILNRATVPTLIETFKGTDLEGRYYEGKKQYILPHQLGTLWTLSADNPEGLEGGQFDFAWLDEGGQLNRHAWVAIQGRTGMHRAPVLITTTPYKLNWLKTEVIDKYKKEKDPDYNVVSWRSTANPHYPVEEYERAKRTLPWSLFRMRYDGEYEAMEGLIFSSYQEEYNVRPVEYNPKEPILVGCDFNVNPMCWVLGHLRNDGLEVFDELFIRNTNTESTVQMMMNRYQEHKGGWQIYGDASGNARKTSASRSDYVIIATNSTLKRQGVTFHIPNVNPGVQDRFAAMNAKFMSAAQVPSLFIDPKCINLIKDIEIRCYKEGSREPDDSADVGHMTDALGYIIHRRWPLRLREPSAKPQIFTTTGA